MSEEQKPKQGKPWTTVGIFDSYESANNQVMHLIAISPTYNYKIKRCGPMDTQIVIKTRIDPSHHEAEQALNKKREAATNKKSSKKSKK